MPRGSDGRAALAAAQMEHGDSGALRAPRGAWNDMTGVPATLDTFPNWSFPSIPAPPHLGASNGSSPGLDVPYFLTESATAVLSIAGNLFICTVILRDRKLRAVVTNHFLVSLAASVFGLLAIAVERYISILKPFRYLSLMTPHNALLAILGSWVLATVIGSLAPPGPSRPPSPALRAPRPPPSQESSLPLGSPRPTGPGSPEARGNSSLPGK
nr:alpha-1B adrenergic receptor-like [Pelodiscus sinensis]|eukprot:XP_025039652.1 alpha-1B adrenergic receptor-like [Pelodiscus sinensis]